MEHWEGAYCCATMLCKFWVWDDGTTSLPALRAQLEGLTCGANVPYAADSKDY